MFMHDTSLAQIAASGAFFSKFNINCANPFLSTQEVTTWCGGNTALETNKLYIGRRNVEGGGRVQDIEHTDWRVVLGVKGKIVDGWDYDVSWQNSIVNLISQAQNYFSTAKIDNALNVVSGPNGPAVRQRAALRALQHLSAWSGDAGSDSPTWRFPGS